ncbi:MAG: DUF1579 family protein [Phycisphaerales bacterium]|nr:DUF1579 family protein [Phycisphaerales bacterium]
MTKTNGVWTIAGIVAVAGLAVANPPRPTTVPAKPGEQPSQPAKPGDSTQKPATPAQPERDWTKREGYDRSAGLSGDKLRYLEQLAGTWNVKIERFGQSGAADRPAGDKPQAMTGIAQREWVLGHKFLQEKDAIGGMEQRREGVRDNILDRDLDRPGDIKKPSDMDMPGDTKKPGGMDKPSDVKKPSDMDRPIDRQPADLGKRIGQPADRETLRPGRNDRVLENELSEKPGNNLPGIMYFGYDQQLDKYVVNFINGMDGSVSVHYGNFDSATKTFTFSTDDPANANISTPSTKHGKDYKVTIRLVSDTEHVVEMHKLGDSGTPITERERPTDPARPATPRDDKMGSDAGNLVYRVTYTKADSTQRSGVNDLLFEDDLKSGASHRDADLDKDLKKDKDHLNKPYDQKKDDTRRDDTKR